MNLSVSSRGLNSEKFLRQISVCRENCSQDFYIRLIYSKTRNNYSISGFVFCQLCFMFLIIENKNFLFKMIPIFNFFCAMAK